MKTIPGILGRARLVSETRGNPLASFPSLAIRERPYNLWLADEVLIPVLKGWESLDLSGRALGAAIAHDVEWASGRCRLAFQSILPEGAALGDPALLAVLGVTANLQRTLALIGEFLLDGVVPGTRAKPEFRLSRFWCGMIDYPPHAPFFPGPMRPPVHPSRLHPTRRDPRHLTNALWCSVGTSHAHCEEAIAILRYEIGRSGLFTPEDVKYLHGPSIAPRFFDRNAAC